MALTLTGPTTGHLDQASSVFTLTESVSIAASTIFTPNDNGAFGTFTPATVTLTPAILSATFTYTPRNSGGAKTIAVTNNAALTNPATRTYTVTVRDLAQRTVGQLIRRALQLLGVIATGETPSAELQEDALTSLNDMLGIWGAEHLLVYSSRNTQVTVTRDFTVGPTGDVIVPRPLAILNAYSRIGGFDRPINVISEAQWNGISDKSITGTYPDHVWYEPGYPNGTVHMSPIGASTMFLQLQTVLDTFTDPSDVLLLPPGYEQAIIFNLAVQLAPEFGQEASPTVQRRAMGAKSVLKSRNAVVPKIYSYRNSGNIMTGWL